MKGKNQSTFHNMLREVGVILAAALLSTFVHVVFSAGPGLDQTVFLSALAFAAGYIEMEFSIRRIAKARTSFNTSQRSYGRLLLRLTIYGLVFSLPLTILWNNLVAFAPALSSYFANALTISVAYGAGAFYCIWFRLKAKTIKLS